MKTCALCGTETDGETCPACGNASWLDAPATQTGTAGTDPVLQGIGTPAAAKSRAPKKG